MIKHKNAVISCAVLFFMVLMCIDPVKVRSGTQNGIIISANIIIPSLFCFMFFVSLFTKCIKRTNIITVWILSSLGGYPIGAKIIEEMYKDGLITKRTANLMQCFCFNAGPAFIVLAVGSGIFGSRKTGVFLLASHLVSSLIIMCVLSCFTDKYKTEKINRIDDGLSVKIILSASDASSSVLSICGFVIIFSVISEFLQNSGYLVYFLEISNSVTLMDNIYFISFLMGFGCICVWIQVFSLSKECGISYPLFITSRIVHGALSSILTYIFVKIFKIKTSVFSNIDNVLSFGNRCGIFLGLSVLLMLTVLIVEITDKKFSGNLKNDIV